ncbi:MAG: 1-acyl-sn-glycerol-3-phosphate acyltransferase, partial [Ruminococcus sp.]|nr:1-acyl-sn-glycerol-3-phosphate acyltransferase [Ruminococcus sp.]
IQRAISLIKNDVASVAVYPEGTRNYGEGLLPFHAAVLKIAQKAEVPIVVMTVQGTYEIQKNYPWKRSEVKMDILDVLPPEEIKGVKTNVLADKIAEMMLNNLEGKE